MALNLQTKTIYPGTSEGVFDSEGKIEVFCDSEYSALEKVNILALPNTYIKPEGKVPQTQVKYDGTDFNVKQYRLVDVDIDVRTDYIADSEIWKKNVTKFKIPEGTKKIAGYKFYGCQHLQEITIPDSVTTIGEGAFQDCKSLTSLIIPNSVTTIDSGALYIGTFSNKATLYFMSTTPPTIHYSALGYINKIYVPAESVEAYKTAPNWSSRASLIEPMP